MFFSGRNEIFKNPKIEFSRRQEVNYIEPIYILISMNLNSFEFNHNEEC